jgi:RNA polymerase sigma factor (sigma-70 family)
LKNLSNEELMKLYAASNSSAFEEIYARFRGRIYGYFLSKLKSPDNAKDLLQEFFRKVHENRASYDPKFKLEAWFFTIAHNILVSFYRRKESKNVDLKENLANAQNEKEETSSITLPKLEEEIGKLSIDQQKILRERFFNDASYADLAKEYGKSEVSIRKILSRGVEKLRKVFKNE